MIILASTSPTRQTMLRNAGLSFRCEAPLVDERVLARSHPEWRPADVALQLAKAKAEEVSQRHPDNLVIGADQVLAFRDRAFSKPSDQEECRQQLMTLRGNTHTLISAVTTARDGKALWWHIDEAKLTMRQFSDVFIGDYLASIGSDCTSTVGGYKIESSGVQLFSQVDGDHFTILGLPLLPLLQQLRDAGELA